MSHSLHPGNHVENHPGTSLCFQPPTDDVYNQLNTWHITQQTSYTLILHTLIPDLYNSMNYLARPCHWAAMHWNGVKLENDDDVIVTIHATTCQSDQLSACSLNNDKTVMTAYSDILNELAWLKGWQVLCAVQHSSNVVSGWPPKLAALNVTHSSN